MQLTRLFLRILVLIPMAQCFGAMPALKIVKAERPGTSLLQNGNFEAVTAERPSSWTPAAGGCSLNPAGRSGLALRSENKAPNGWAGASQTVVLNRTNAVPLVVRGWSKAQEVSGSPDSGYSLYVDILYQDGTPLWGQTANFRTGTHDWQQRELLILPEKAVKSLTLHCILRGHSGTAWFDDVSVEEITGSSGAVLFEDLPVEVLSPTAREPRGRNTTVEKLLTGDKLGLTFRSGKVQSLRIGGTELVGGAPSGFLARDVAAASDIFGFDGLQGDCPDLKLSLRTEYQVTTNCIRFRGHVSDTSRRDRAVTLYFSIPVDALGWQWGDDIRRERAIDGTAALRNNVAVGCGATGTMSLYPLAAIHNQKQGLALGLDMAQAGQWRLCYNAGTKQFLAAWDFALVPDASQFPSSAEFSFVLFRFNPQWGFRAAFQRFTEIFPEHFRVRTRDQGIWMPFTDVSTVQGWEDFGFKYHEGNNNVPWDDAHGILSFRYTEPMTWWMPMPTNVPRSTTEALRIRDELAAKPDKSAARMAQVTKAATMWDEQSEPALSFRDTPWCNGTVWSLNPNPALPAGNDASGSPYNAATVHWNPSLKEELYGAKAKGRQDGEYLDSIEGYVTTDLNFRREHFRYSSVPLTFTTDTRQPVLWKGLAVYEFTRWLSADVHGLGKLMFANGVPYRLSFLCPWLDVLGTETDWLRNGKYSPPSDSQMSLWRTMSGGKPFLLLMNTDYDAFGLELVEKYFQRSLFYGMFPSMFSHNAADNPYWQNPKWYNRDRLLFKRYIPLIKRVAEAGWQPVTYATCDNPRILIERFGPDEKGALFFTLLNDSNQPASGTVKIDLKSLGLKSGWKVRNLISGEASTLASFGPLTLQSEQATALSLTRD
jgi:hypothetical protein